MLSRECAARGVKPQKVSRIMKKLFELSNEKQLVHELAEDNAPGMRRWDELRTELRLQLRVQEFAMLFPDRFAEDPEPFSDLDTMEG